MQMIENAIPQPLLRLAKQSSSNILFVVQFALFLWISLDLLEKSFFDKGDASKFSNTFCLSHKDECTLDYTFDKVLYFWLDGVSWDTASPIFNEFISNNTNIETTSASNNTSNVNLYRVLHDVTPWSGAVFSTYMTGKTGKNMGAVLADNLIYQMKKTGKQIYIAAEPTPSYVMYGVDGLVDEEQVQYLPGVVSDDVTESSFGWLFNCASGDQKECAYSVLNKIKSEERSAFFESFFIDHKLHFEVQNRWSPIVLESIADLASKLKYVKQWVDENPDYLLVLVSDHGGKVDAMEVHGPVNDPTNAAWNLYYSPQFGAHANERVVGDVVQTAPTIRAKDVCVTFWQFLSGGGVSIPAESIGVVSTPTYASPENHLKALTLNANQLYSYAKRVNLGGVGSVPSHTGDTERDITEMKQYSNELSLALADRMSLTSLFVVLILLILLQTGRIVKTQLFQKGVCAKEVLKTYGWYLPGPFIVAICVPRFTAGLIWNGGPNYHIYIYVVFMLAVAAMSVIGKAAKRTIARNAVADAKRANAHDVEKGPSSNKVSFGVKTEESYIPLQVYNEEQADASECDEIDGSPALRVAPSPSPSVVDLLADKQWKQFFVASFRYLVGLNPIEAVVPSQTWIVLSTLTIGITSAFMFGLPIEDFLGVSIQAMGNHVWIRVLFTLCVLWVEFRWQRRLLMSTNHVSHVKTNDARECDILRYMRTFKRFCVSNQIFFYFKILIYLILTWCIYRNEEAKYELFEIWTVYIVCFAHIVGLLFLGSAVHTELVFPVYYLVLLVSTPKEQLIASYFMLALLPLSNTLVYRRRESRGPSEDRHILPFLVMLMIMVTHYLFVYQTEQQYTTQNIALSIPGVHDITEYPLFSVGMMLFHKMSFFILLVPLLIRLSSNQTLNKRSSNENSVVVWDLLVFFGCFTVLFYLLVFLQKQMDEAFVWTATTIVIVNLFGMCLLVGRVVCWAGLAASKFRSLLAIR